MSELVIGARVQMTALARAAWRGPYSGEFRGYADRGKTGVRVLRFGASHPTEWPAEFWEPFAEGVSSRCARCGEFADEFELDECLGCRTRRICMACMRDHRCDVRAAQVGA